MKTILCVSKICDIATAGLRSFLRVVLSELGIPYSAEIQIRSCVSQFGQESGNLDEEIERFGTKIMTAEELLRIVDGPCEFQSIELYFPEEQVAFGLFDSSFLYVRGTEAQRANVARHFDNTCEIEWERPW